MKRNYLRQINKKKFASVFIAMALFMALPNQSKATELKTSNQTDKAESILRAAIADHGLRKHHAQIDRIAIIFYAILQCGYSQFLFILRGIYHCQ